MKMKNVRINGKVMAKNVKINGKVVAKNVKLNNNQVHETIFMVQARGLEKQS
jgi:hypothetical protein